MPRIAICADCGEEKEYYAKGFCSPCYQRQYNHPIRICLSCGEEKPHGGRGLCTICHKRQWDANHREQVLAYAKDYREEHRQERLIYREKWYRANQDYFPRWRKNNPDKIRAQSQQRKAWEQSAYCDLSLDDIEEILAIGHAVYPGEDLHLDHVVPISKGGNTTRANIHAIPARMNQSKGNKLPSEAYGQLALCFGDKELW